MNEHYIYKVFLSVSAALHWAVLINTNGWYGCEELNSRSTKQVNDAKNFASPRRSAHADVEDLFTPQKASVLLYSFLKSPGTPGISKISKSWLTNIQVLAAHSIAELRRKRATMYQIGMWMQVIYSSIIRNCFINYRKLFRFTYGNIQTFVVVSSYVTDL